MNMQTQTAGGEDLSLPETEAGKSPGFSFGQSARQRFQSVPITPESDADLTELERACAGIYLYAARQKEPDETKGWSLEQQSREIPRLAEELGVTPELVRLSPRAAADQAWCNRLAQLDKTPLTNRWLTEGDNAVYATKSFHSLGKIEEEAISYRHGMRSLHGSLSDFQFLLSAQGKEGKESETRDEYAYFHLGYGEKIKRLMREAEASGLEKEEVFALLAKETPNLLNGLFKPTPLSEEEKAGARRRYGNPVYRDVALRKALRASNAPTDVAASLAHDLARTEDWTPLLDEHLDQQSRSLFEKMTATQGVLADTEERIRRYDEENGTFASAVSFGQEVRYRWEEQQIGLRKVGLIRQAQELAVAEEGLRVERILETAQARSLDPWSIAVQIRLHGPRSLENLSDAQVEQARHNGDELRNLLKVARYDESVRKDVAERYGLIVGPFQPDDPQTLMESMLREGFAKDDLLSGVDSKTQQRRPYHAEFLHRIAQRNVAVLLAGPGRKAWLHQPGGSVLPVEGRNEEELAQMKAALMTGIGSHEEARTQQKERFQSRHPVYQALDRHPETQGELIWRYPGRWLDGGLATLTAGLPTLPLEVATVGSLSDAQTYAGVLLKGTENSSAQALQKRLLDPLSLMEAHDEASRKGMISRTISMGSLMFGAKLVTKALGLSSTVGRMAGAAGGGAGTGGAAMALDQFNVKGKVDWAEVVQVMPSLLLLGLLGTGKARTPQELAKTLKAAIPEIEQQAAKTLVGELQKEISLAKEAGMPADRSANHLASLLKEYGIDTIVLPQKVLREFLAEKIAKDPNMEKNPTLAALGQRLLDMEATAAPMSVPLADLLPYLPDISGLIENGWIGSMKDLQAASMAKKESVTSPLQGGKVLAEENTTPLKQGILIEEGRETLFQKVQEENDPTVLLIKEKESPENNNVLENKNKNGINGVGENAPLPNGAEHVLSRKGSNGKPGWLGKEELAVPDKIEIPVGQRLTELGYNVLFLEELSKRGIKDARTADMLVQELGYIEIYTPIKLDLGKIITQIEKKSKQAPSILVQFDLSITEMTSVAMRMWGKKSAKGLGTLYFMRSDGSILRFNRPMDKY